MFTSLTAASWRAAAAAAAGGACLITLAACGSTPASPASSGSTSQASPGTSAAAASSASAAGTRSGSHCPASALRATVSTTQGGAAAGTDYVPIDFTNVSGRSCDLYGYPGVSFVTGHPGSQIGSPAARDKAFGAVTVTLAKGGSAHAWLGLADVGNFSASQCRPVTAHMLRIYAPGDYTAIYASFTAQVCSGKIPGGSTGLTVMTVHPGAGATGKVP